MTASVIIPAYNEEDRLGRLLDDLANQTEPPGEVILADAHSTDRTRDIARARSVTVVDGGLPAAGRNAGAAVATGDVLVFLDADVRLPRTFIGNALREMQEKDAVVATCEAKPMSDLTADRLIHVIANLFIRINQDSSPHAPGYCILVHRAVFEATGGFDEKLKVAEDHDFVSRAAGHGRFRLLSSTHVKVDVRRFEKEGRIGYSAKAIQITLHRAIHGEITDPDEFEYEFGSYDEDESSGAEKALRKMERGLLKADRRVRKLEDKLWAAADTDTIRDRARELFAEVSTRIEEAGRALMDRDRPARRRR